MSSSKPPVKVGLLVDSRQIPAWAHHALARSVDSGCARIELLVVNSTPPFRPQYSVQSMPITLPFMYRLLDSVDAALFARNPDPFAPQDIGPLCPGASEMRVRPLREENCVKFDDETVSRICGFDLDVLVLFGFAGLNVAGLHASRLGTWYYNHSDGGAHTDELPGYWEVVGDDSTTGSSLHASGGALARGVVLHRASHFTYPLSPTRSRSYCFWASAAFLPRKLRQLHDLGGEEFVREAERNDPEGVPFSPVSQGIPSNFTTVLHFSRIFARCAKTLARRIAFRDTWYLLCGPSGWADPRFRNFRAMMPPGDRFWADPMVVRRDGKYYIFVEELLYASGRGHISVIEMDDQGHWRDPVPVLKSPVHLSYPFVFCWDGKYYMIPESVRSRSIDLYECEAFPSVWRLKTCLMKDIAAVDTTLFRHRDRWWLFTAVSEHPGAHPQVELFLYYADDLLAGVWHSHPRNPIVSDIRRARPAGRIFLEDGKIFRPSQNGGSTYGDGFDINEVEVLSETDYREKTVRSLRPDRERHILASHTIAQEGGLTVIDAFTRRPRFRVPFKRPDRTPERR